MTSKDTAINLGLAGGTSEEKPTMGGDNYSLRPASHRTTQDVLGDALDPVLTAKTRLVNEALNEIGWTSFHLKLSCLTGFGFAVDSLAAFLQSVAASQAYLEIGSGRYPTAATMALYAGLLVGALFWGFSADMIGRRIAFNTTLFIASIATIVAGAVPNWVAYCIFVAFLGFGAGGNLVLDPTIMLEFTPAKQQWVITALAGWWGVGQASAGFIAWGFYSRSDWTCDGADERCTWQNNKAWRLIMFTGGSLFLVMSILRIFVVRLPETPKYLVSTGQDEKLVSLLHHLAQKHNRPCALSAEQLQACGSVEDHRIEKGSYKSMPFRIGRAFVSQSKGLFATRKLGLSTVLIWLSWTLIGLGYPLFFLYLPTRVPGYVPSFTETWRDYTITNVCSIFGPLVAAGLAEINFLGRRYTMSIGAMITAIFFFSYTVIKTPAQNLALSCCISVCINLYYGTLYAYTAEVFPSPQRATGNGIAVALNRVMGLISAFIAVEANTATVTPLYVSAALFVVLALVSAVLPYEPRGRNAS
ncbi:major facilitator superfamily domain-containing protein [Dactylonectria macrodidyma]|uniref:Major facilitator superfamily domain-containing protein n=1 Tax=Dactylonectria macrodidyma TaxID=307937 RepID=A0A9P9DQ72_9HYPO|nr:major facilitator superfamily domain-containing protein [Dactylonectria macrodidyma]